MSNNFPGTYAILRLLLCSVDTKVKCLPRRDTAVNQDAASFLPDDSSAKNPKTNIQTAVSFIFHVCGVSCRPQVTELYSTETFLHL
jgi:hypothetical protein